MNTLPDLAVLPEGAVEALPGSKASELESNPPNPLDTMGCHTNFVSCSNEKGVLNTSTVQQKNRFLFMVE